MALGVAFNQSVGALITEGPLGRMAIEGAREVGLQLDKRAPGVVPTFDNEFGIGQP